LHSALREDNIEVVKERQKRNQLPPSLAMNKEYCGVSNCVVLW
jgi:hypothetical protein